MSKFDSVLVAHANIRYIQSHPELSEAELNELLAFVHDLTNSLSASPSWATAYEEGLPTMSTVTDLISSYVMVLLERSRNVAALDVLEDFVTRQQQLAVTPGSTLGNFKTGILRGTFFKMTEVIVQEPSVDLKTVLRIAILNEVLGTVHPALIAAHILRVYYSAKDANLINSMSPKDWIALNRVARSVAMDEFGEFVHNSNLALPANFQFRGYKEFVRDWATALPDAQSVRQIPMKQLVSTLSRLYHLDDVKQFADELGPAWASWILLELPKVDSILSIEENMSSVGSGDLTAL